MNEVKLFNPGFLGWQQEYDKRMNIFGLDATGQAYAHFVHLKPVNASSV